MSRPEVTGRKMDAVRPKKLAPNDVDAFSVAEFCRRHGISIQVFYKHRHLMPHTFNVGTRVLVSKEAAARWRAEREAASHTESDTAA